MVARRGSAAVYYRSSVSVYRELDLCQHRDSIERVLCPGPVYQEVNARKSRARRLRPGGDPQEVRAGRGALGERSGHDQALFRTANLSHPSQEVSCAKIETSARGGARAAWPGASAVRGRRVYSQHGRPCTCPRSAQACLPFHRAVSFHRSLFTCCNNVALL
jgi:hypothetical protein